MFQVSPELALQRLRQIRERITSSEFLSAFNYTAVTKEERLPIPNTTEPIIRGIYGLDDLSRPHTLVIEQRDGFDWENPLYIEVDGCFKSIDYHQRYSLRDGAIVSSGDLSVPREHFGFISIDMGRISSRHGQTSNRLFLSMEAIDDALNF